MTRTGSPDGVLFEWYERYVGPPTSETDVYLGFSLFFGGIVLGVVGLATFLWSATIPVTNGFHWQLREVAVVAAALGLPGFLLGVVVLLPADDRALWTATGGTAVCMAAMAVFVFAYPYHWNVQPATDYSAQGIALYAVGVTGTVAATAAALVAHHLDRVRPIVDSEETEEEVVTDEQVERDIEEALSDVELSWGGVARKETRSLSFAENDVSASGFDPENATRSRSSGVDDAVAGLKRLQGDGPAEQRGDGAEAQATALKELRESQQEPQRDTGVIARLRRWTDRLLSD